MTAPGPLAVALSEIAVGLAADLARLPLSSKFREKYELERLLACGSMGAVFLARQKELARAVALKFLVTDSDLMRARFRREAALMAQISHPHVLRLLDHGDEAGLLYHAFEYLPGGTLGSLVAKRIRLAAPDAVSIAIQCLSGLAALHGRGIVHRDLKPDNVLFGDDGAARIADLGIARDETATAGLTRDGALLGTPRYMAPEQARGDAAGEASDIYAMGCIVYHMLAGEPPFAGGDPVTLLRKHILEAPRPLAQVVTGVPPLVGDVVMQALAKDPAARPGSAGAFATALALALEGKTPAKRETRPQPRPRSRVARAAGAALMAGFALGAVAVVRKPAETKSWVVVNDGTANRKPETGNRPTGSEGDGAEAALADVRATDARVVGRPPQEQHALVRELIGRLRARVGPRSGALLTERLTHVAIEDLYRRADELKRLVEESMMNLLLTEPGSATRKPDFVRRTTAEFEEVTRDLRDVAPAVMFRGAPALARAHFAQTAMIFLRPSFQILDVRIKNRFDDEIRRWMRERPTEFVGWYVESERAGQDRQWLEQARALDRAMALLEAEWADGNAEVAGRASLVHVWADVLARQSRNVLRLRDARRGAELLAHVLELEQTALRVEPGLARNLVDPKNGLAQARDGRWQN